MRRADPSVVLAPEQASIASMGVKGMIPIARPFLEYVVSALADAGLTQVVLVVGPGADPVREHFARVPTTRVTIAFAEQAEPVGTANAVVSATSVVRDEAFLVLNADNYYPVEAYRALASEATAGTVAFDRDALVREGNIDADRVRSYAVLSVSEQGTLNAILEKPGATLDPTSEAARWVGMNLWAIDSRLIDACRRVPRSSRGEHELPEAVGMALREGATVRALRMHAPVLDLSQQSDIPHVTQRLASIAPRL
jgi:UDP-N-acetylglucosamine diphosphorylase / glucose-1-phosphate thymidylyltransferase / UDP-N-acetylgalactosamine diphosphorylase / glucosamine-1-phosphate N-acetyltransferase / galactosamine-1-phosphate N-acetyltransferase